VKRLSYPGQWKLCRLQMSTLWLSTRE